MLNCLYEKHFSIFNSTTNQIEKIEKITTFIIKTNIIIIIMVK